MSLYQQSLITSKKLSVKNDPADGRDEKARINLASDSVAAGRENMAADQFWLRSPQFRVNQDEKRINPFCLQRTRP